MSDTLTYIMGGLGVVAATGVVLTCVTSILDGSGNSDSSRYTRELDNQKVENQ